MLRKRNVLNNEGLDCNFVVPITVRCSFGAMPFRISGAYSVWDKEEKQSRYSVSLAGKNSILAGSYLHFIHSLAISFPPSLLGELN